MTELPAPDMLELSPGMQMFTSSPATTTTADPAAPKRIVRLAVGATISVAYPADLLERINAAAKGAGLTRAAWLRQAAAAEARQVENRSRVELP